MDHQVRTFDLEGVEIRESGDGGRKLVGHAAVFDVDSRPIGGRFVERIERGAFSRAIREGQDVRALNQHRPEQVLGRTKSGTLRLSEDERGLAVEIDLPRTSYADDLVEQVQRRDVDQMSFAFRAARGGERFESRAGPGGIDRRVLTDVDLFDVSPVTFAAYEETALALRSYVQHAGGIPHGRQIAAVDTHVEPATDAPAETRACFSGHLGLYAMEVDRLIAAVDAVREGLLKPRTREELRASLEAAAIEATEHGPGFGCTELTDEERKTFQRRGLVWRGGGLAELPIEGALTKRFSKYAGDFTKGIAHRLDFLLDHPKVEGIMLRIDSPGGEAAGTAELGEAIAAAEKRKPTHAFVDDLAASAGYWLASQAGRITVNRTGEVGSIGVYGVVHDSEEAYRKEGVKVHVISSGPEKGQGVPGTAIPKSYLDRRAERVHELHEHFVEAVAGGRGLSVEAVHELATGRCYSAERALEAGLVDAVGTYEDALDELRAIVSDDPVPGAGDAPATADADVETGESPEDRAGVPISLRKMRTELERLR